MLGTNVNPQPIHGTSVLGLGKNVYQISIYQRVSQNTDRSPKSRPGTCTRIISVTIQDTNIHQYYQGIYVNTKLKHVRDFNPKLVPKTSLTNILNYVKDTYHPLSDMADFTYALCCAPSLSPVCAVLCWAAPRQSLYGSSVYLYLGLG